MEFNEDEVDDGDFDENGEPLPRSNKI